MIASPNDKRTFMTSPYRNLTILTLDHASWSMAEEYTDKLDFKYSLMKTLLLTANLTTQSLRDIIAIIIGRSSWT